MSKREIKQMHVTEKRNKKGEIVSYKARISVGDEIILDTSDPNNPQEKRKQVWRVLTIPHNDSRLEGLSPAKRLRAAQAIANEWAEEQQAAYERDHNAKDKTKITLKDFINEHWIPQFVNNGKHKPSSVEFYNYMATDIVSYFGAEKKLKDISNEDIIVFVKWMQQSARTGKDAPYSASTIQHHFAALRNIMKFALRFHYINTDPFSELDEGDKPSREQKPVDFLKLEDAKRFVKCLDDEYKAALEAGTGAKAYIRLFWSCFFNTLLTLGLRRGECLGLQWQDINESKQTLKVERNVTMDKNSPNKRHIGTPKSGKSRVVHIPPRLLSMLKTLKAEQERRLDCKLLPNAFIFGTDEDLYTPTYPTVPTRRLSEFIKRNNLPDVSPHDLRHSCASLAIAAGASAKEVQTLLGHADISTTFDNYVGLFDEANEAVVSSVDRMISQG